MKLNVDVKSDSIIIRNDDDEILAVEIKIKSGVIVNLDISPEVDIHDLTRFINRAKAKYTKFLRSKAIEEFEDL